MRPRRGDEFFIMWLNVTRKHDGKRILRAVLRGRGVGMGDAGLFWARPEFKFSI
jgi:hypothetical protein